MSSPWEKTMPQTFSVGARSLFVTVTAWLFIALASMGVVSAVVQQAMASGAPAVSTHGLPIVTAFLVEQLPWVLLAGLCFAVATLVAAVGMLIRLEWARRVFICVLAVTIVFNLAGLWLQHEVVQAVVAATLKAAPLPPSVAEAFVGFVTASRVMGVAMTLVGCALCGWIIRRLMSPAVRQEFA
jgi:hypothetical protein